MNEKSFSFSSETDVISSFVFILKFDSESLGLLPRPGSWRRSAFSAFSASILAVVTELAVQIRDV